MRQSSKGSSQSQRSNKPPDLPTKSSNRTMSAFYGSKIECSNSANQPTIIKPNDRPTVSKFKKRAPPRPPPPKIIGGKNAPPSYDEVMEAERWTAPHSYSNPGFPDWNDSHAKPAPAARPVTLPLPRPIAPSGNKKPLARTTGSKPINQVPVVKKPSDDLLELADIFNRMQATQSPSMQWSVEEKTSFNHSTNQFKQSNSTPALSAQTSSARKSFGPRVLPPSPSEPFGSNHKGVPGHVWPPPMDAWNNDIDTSSLNRNSVNLIETKRSNFNPPITAAKPSNLNDSSADKVNETRGSTGFRKDESNSSFPLRTTSINTTVEGNYPPLPPRPLSYTSSDVHSANTKEERGRKPSGPHAVSLFDYDASQSDELSFKTGDSIALVRRINAEWLFGRLGHKEGMFPSTFVEIVVSLPNDDATASPSPGPRSGEKCRAMFDYIGTSSEDLSLREGEVVTIEGELDSTWLKGRTQDGRSGMFPASFVEVIDGSTGCSQPAFTNITDDWKKVCNSYGSLATSSQATYQEESSVVGSKNNFKYHDAIGEYLVLYDFEAQEAGELNLKQGQKVFATGSSGDDWLVGYIIGSHDTQDKIFPKSFVSKLDDDGGSGSAKVLYDFEATSPEELHCLAGQTVKILQEVSNEWVMAEKNGVSGLVPTSFIQILQ